MMEKFAMEHSRTALRFPIARWLPLVAALGGALFTGCKPPAQPGYGAASPFRDDAPSNVPLVPEFPTRFVDRDGKAVDLAEFRGRKSVVVVILRGVPKDTAGEFCVNCLAQVGGLMANREAIAQRGAEVVVLFPGPTETLDQFILQARARSYGNAEMTFPLVIDRDFAIADRLDIRGDLVKPSTYILDKQGRLVYAYVGSTTGDRPSMKALLGQLDKLAATP